MKIHVYPYNDFVIPFILGVILLFAICIFKYVRWIRKFSYAQRRTLRKNWYSWKIIPAAWEMIREGLFHKRILKKNLLLGLMHQSFALGWFLLIIVGDIESRNTFHSLQREQSIETVHELEEQEGWYVYHTDKDKNFGYFNQRRYKVETEEGIARIHYKRPFYIAIFYRYFIHKAPESFRQHKLYSDIMDGLLIYILLGLAMAMVKIFWSKILGMRRTTKHTLVDRFSKFSLWMIFPLRLLSESVSACLYGNGGFLTQAIGNLFDPMIVRGLETSLWMFYSLMLAIFFITLPFSRYMHIFTELLLIWFRKIGVTEELYKTGYTQFELNACSRCGVCITGCPIDRVLDNHEIQPVYLIRSLRNKEHGSRLNMIAENCLMCDRCTVDCPVGIDLNSIRRMTRNKGAIDTKGNYSYLTKKQIPFNAIGRVAYFGGCMSHLTPGITESMEKIFIAAEQKYWYMDKQDTICCGRPLYQQGFFNQAAELRKKNTDMIKQSYATMLVTSCPICYQSFKKEYNLDIPVIHHTTYIDILLKQGLIKVRHDDRKVSYHDPCELGRGCGIYEEPRRVINAVTNLQKTRYQKEKSVCCGFNLGDTRASVEEQTRIRNASLANLTSKPVDTIITACPMCKKAFQHATNDYPVKDIAEIVAENLIN
ncbi:MAG: (Fe-S)-binding protein [Bacteroidaceae bacterium]|jgi:Fe-S oxidoreductase|nr:(Fe-S)-binding protein [Bacteroidales bacterium]HBA13081.1 (Fe-S)-binding protein [Bacteroidales bacterium]